MERTVAMLRDLVSGHVDAGASVTEACEAVAAEIGVDLEAWWSELGTAFVRKLGAPLQSGSRGLSSSSSSVPAPRPSWRTALRRQPDRALDLELPVGGQLKPVREFTVADIQAVERAYHGLASSLTTRAEQWRRIRRRMHSFDTVGTAVDAGRLTETDLVFVGNGCAQVLELEAAG